MKHFKLKTVLLLEALLLFTLQQDLLGQNSKKTLALGINYARHGSGDMDGIMVNFDYNRNYSKKVSVIYNLGVTIHGQKAIPGTIENDPMIPEDLRTDVPQWVTAGLQLSTLLTYNLTAGYNNGLKIGVGPVLRYQLNSYPNGYAYYAQGNPWFRQPFYVIQETDDNKFNLGYAIRLSYDFKSKKDKFFGINMFLQNDTNADMIVGLGLKIGLKLK